MRNSGNTSTRLVSRFRGSVGFMRAAWSSVPPRALLGNAGLLLERLDRLRQLFPHAARVLATHMNGAVAAAAQAAQRRQRAGVARVAQLLDQDLSLVARGRLL